MRYCNNCPHATKKNEGSTGRYASWYCSYQTLKQSLNNDKVYLGREVGSWLDVSHKLEAPSWCPVECNRRPHFDLDEWKKIQTNFQWESVKVGEIYHIPPINGDERADVVITSVSQYTITGRIINGKKKNEVIYFYPTSIKTKFLVKNQIIQFKNGQ